MNAWDAYLEELINIEDEKGIGYDTMNKGSQMALSNE